MVSNPDSPGRLSIPAHPASAAQKKLQMTFPLRWWCGLGLLLVVMPQLWRWVSPPPTWKNPLDQALAAARSKEPALETRLAVRSKGSPGPQSASALHPTQANGHAAEWIAFPPEFFATAEDDKVLKKSEGAAWANLLEEVTSKPSPTAGWEQADVAALLEQTSWYRGRWVAVQGIVRRTVKKSLPREGKAPLEYYELWLWPGNNVCIVCCTQLPEGFPVETKMSEPVEVRGVLFKRLSYQAVDDLRVAPLLAAASVSWERPLAARQDAKSAGQFYWWLVVPFAGLFSYWLYRKSVMPPRGRIELPARIEVPQQQSPRRNVSVGLGTNATSSSDPLPIGLPSDGDIAFSGGGTSPSEERGSRFSGEDDATGQSAGHKTGHGDESHPDGWGVDESSGDAGTGYGAGDSWGGSDGDGGSDGGGGGDGGGGDGGD